MRSAGLASVRVKFLLPLLIVAAVSLSAAVILRGFIVRDFRQFLEGSAEDRVQLVVNDLEGEYVRHGALQPEASAAAVVRALMLGVDAKVYGADDRELMSPERALAGLSPLMKKRVLASLGAEFSDPSGTYTPYPLYVGGREIGHLEVRYLKGLNDAAFIRTSDRYLWYISLAVGALAILLGVVLARRFSVPLRRLTQATQAIAAGDYSSRALAFGRDELGQLAESFNRMADALQTQERLRKKLMSNAAHELRTPLMVIRGELEAMIDGVLPVAPEILQSLHDEAGRLTVVLEGIDDLTRAEAASLNLQCQELSLEQYLGALVQRFRLQGTSRGVAVEWECAAGTTVFADPDRLTQVLINLFSNALKATGAGGAIRFVAASDGQNALLEVTDTGKGIAEPDLPHIFERFYRVEQGGLGLGLAIVSELVGAHDGTIEVKSRPGEGTTFSVRLPAQRPGH